MRAADLVAIARADAAAGGADVLAIGGAFVERAILGKVPGKDHVRPIADSQILGVAGPALGEFIELFDHAGRVEDHAGGDHACNAGRENAAGEQRELVDLVADDDRVPGVRPALIADDEIVLPREAVDDFAFGFVAPLQTDNASARHRSQFEQWRDGSSE